MYSHRAQNRTEFPCQKKSCPHSRKLLRFLSLGTIIPRSLRSQRLCRLFVILHSCNRGQAGAHSLVRLFVGFRTNKRDATKAIGSHLTNTCIAYSKVRCFLKDLHALFCQKSPTFGRRFSLFSIEPQQAAYSPQIAAGSFKKGWGVGQRKRRSRGFPGLFSAEGPKVVAFGLFYEAVYLGRGEHAVFYEVLAKGLLEASLSTHQGQ